MIQVALKEETVQQIFNAVIWIGGIHGPALLQKLNGVKNQHGDHSLAFLPFGKRQVQYTELNASQETLGNTGCIYTN